MFKYRVPFCQYQYGTMRFKLKSSLLNWRIFFFFIFFFRKYQLYGIRPWCSLHVTREGWRGRSTRVRVSTFPIVWPASARLHFSGLTSTVSRTHCTSPTYGFRLRQLWQSFLNNWRTKSFQPSHSTSLVVHANITLSGAIIKFAQQVRIAFTLQKMFSENIWWTHAFCTLNDIFANNKINKVPLDLRDLGFVSLINTDLKSKLKMNESLV